MEMVHVLSYETIISKDGEDTHLRCKLIVSNEKIHRKKRNAHIYTYIGCYLQNMRWRGRLIRKQVQTMLDVSFGPSYISKMSNWTLATSTLKR